MREPDIEVALLGSLSLTVSGVSIPVRATQQRALLAALALAAPQPVLPERLIDLLWPEQAPATARAALHNNIRRLRTSLSASGVGDLITTGPAGYRLAVSPEQVDVGRFIAARKAAQGLAEKGQITEAAEAYEQALNLWVGEPFPDLQAAGLLATQAEQLVEARIAATEEWAQLAAEPAQAERVLGHLQPLVEAWPLRESLRARFMLVLHTAGRTADALAQYSQARQLLVSELGIEPGMALRAAHQHILRLEGPPPTVAAERVPFVTPAQLPPLAGSLVGRGHDLALLDVLQAQATDEAVGARVGVVSGPAGVGKSTLAVHWARSIADDFPDGQLFVNLRGFDPSGTPALAADVLRGFLIALGVPAEQVPVDLDAATGLFRSHLAQRRVLVVLDNARDAGQVRPLLPTGPGSLALVTSRHDLASLRVTHRAMSLSLDLLTTADAEAMLADRLGVLRVSAEPRAAGEIIARCGGLPLALAVVAARVAARADLSLAALATELREVASPLDVLEMGDPSVDVRAVLSWTVQALDEPTATTFGLLGLHPGPDLSAASVVSLTGRAPREIRSALGELVRAHLVVDRSGDRVTFHDLIRAHARERVESAESQESRSAALERLVDHYVHSAFAATRLHFSSPLSFVLAPPAPGVVPEAFATAEQAAQWLEAEQAALVRVGEIAADEPGLETRAWQLARILNGSLWDRCLWADMAQLQEGALRATVRAGDVVGQADARHGLADAYAGLERYDEALAQLGLALDLFRDAEDRTGESDVECTFGRVLEGRGSYREALVHTEAALAIYRDIGDRTGQAVSLNNLGWLHACLGDHQRSLENCQQSLDLYRAEGDLPGQAYALDSLGLAHLGLHDYVSGIALLAEGVEVSRAAGQHFNQSESLSHLAEAYESIGDVEAARTAWRSALAILEALDHPRAAEVRAQLEALVDPSLAC